MSSEATLRQISPLFRGSGISGNVFTKFTELADKHGAINLGQGYPEFEGPEELKKTAAGFFAGVGSHQYTSSRGLKELRAAISATDEHFYGLKTDPDRDVLVTAGATAALNLSFRVFLEPGEEVILFEPFYNLYDSLIRTAGGVPKYVALSTPDWAFDPAEVDEAVSDKTKLILLNSPMNPIGKVFTRQELESIADIAKRHGLYVISDEAYEFMAFGENEHIPISTLDDMKDRTIRISSVGKTFSVTGWRVGYLSAPESLIPSLLKAQELANFCIPEPLQRAVIKGLEDTAYLEGLAGMFNEKSQLLSMGLKKAGFSVLSSQGGYFVCADFSDFDFKGDGADFSQYLTRAFKVTPMPLQFFYSGSNKKGENLLRFCIAKEDTTLKQACHNLSRFEK